MEAPTPKRIICENCPYRPEFYGKEYHGVMGHKEATLLLEEEPNGAFLIRKGNELNDFYTLSWRYFIIFFYRKLNIKIYECVTIFYKLNIL